MGEAAGGGLAFFMFARQSGLVPDEQQVRMPAVSLVVRTWRAEQAVSPATVLVPGTAETADDWDVVAAALARRRIVYAVNLRGHGASDCPGTYSIKSMADDLCGLLPRLSSGPLDVVGHSLGGLVACLVAASRPELVRRLILEDVGPAPAPDADICGPAGRRAAVRLADGRAGEAGDRRPGPGLN